MAAPGTPSAPMQFGPEHVWARGDAVAKGTIIILVIMSAWSWWVILTKVWDQQRIKKQAKLAERDFWSAANIKQAIDSLKGGRSNPFRALAEAAFSAAQHHDGKGGEQIDRSEWIRQALDRTLDSINHYLQAGLSVLATVGSTAPFVGLFGTVWGILNALLTISREGQASIDKISGPVGESLVMTAFGLFVAVPAVLGYNWLLRRNKMIQGTLRNFAIDLHDYLLTGSRINDKPMGPKPTPSTPAR